MAGPPFGAAPGSASLFASTTGARHQGHDPPSLSNRRTCRPKLNERPQEGHFSPILRSAYSSNAPAMIVGARRAGSIAANTLSLAHEEDFASRSVRQSAPAVPISTTKQNTTVYRHDNRLMPVLYSCAVIVLPNH
jgi:hypothetical protein